MQQAILNRGTLLALLCAGSCLAMKPGNDRGTPTDAGAGNDRTTLTDDGDGNDRDTLTDAGDENDRDTLTDAGAGNDRTILPDAEAGDDRDTLTDAGAEADCAHRQPPPPPEVTGRGGTLDLVLAMHTFVYGWASSDDAGKPKYQSIGFDLDNKCTGEGEGPSCQEPVWATASHHDGVDGIDNVQGELVWPQGPESNTETTNGVNILLRVRGYSGDANDDQVEVSLYYAPGLSPREDGGLDLLWDGKDRWAASPDCLLPPTDGSTPSVDQPRFVDDHAYVTNGVLVSRLQEGLWQGTSDLPEPTRHVVIAGALTQNDGGLWQMTNATIGFAVALKDYLFNTAWFPWGPGGAYQLCQAPTYYPLQVMNTCAIADIAFDSSSPTAPCDAISFGIGFDAIQARLGDVMDASALPLASCDPTLRAKLSSCDSLGSD
jgi:hypothetical protein